MENSTVILLMSFLCFFSWLFCNWHIRITFVMTGTKWKGTGNKREKRYKRKWKFWQRMLLFPLYSESKFRIYMFLFILNWIHFFLAALVVIVLSFELYGIISFIHWKYYFCTMGVVLLFEIGTTLTVARRR